MFLISRAVYLSSPTLNYIITVGALTMYISVIFALVPTKEPTCIKALCAVSKVHLKRLCIQNHLYKVHMLSDYMNHYL